MRFLTCLVILILTSGCGTTVDTIDVPYQSAESGKPKPVAGAGDVTVSVVASDARTTNGDRVSSKINGFGTELAAIVASNDLPETLRAAIEQEMAARGYKIGKESLQISVSILKFYNQYAPGFFGGTANAEVAFEMKITKPDRTLVFSKSYRGSGTETGLHLANGSNARAVLITALASAVAEMANDSELHNALLNAGRPDIGPGGKPNA